MQDKYNRNKYNRNKCNRNSINRSNHERCTYSSSSSLNSRDTLSLVVRFREDLSPEDCSTYVSRDCI